MSQNVSEKLNDTHFIAKSCFHCCGQTCRACLNTKLHLHPRLHPRYRPPRRHAPVRHLQPWGIGVSCKASAHLVKAGEAGMRQSWISKCPWAAGKFCLAVRCGRFVLLCSRRGLCARKAEWWIVAQGRFLSRTVIVFPKRFVFNPCCFSLPRIHVGILFFL